MKNMKIVSVFLSMTLGMTSFAAIPVTAAAAETELTITTVENEAIYFSYPDSEKGYCACQIGEKIDLNLENYDLDNNDYEFGVSPIYFRIKDKSIARIDHVQGSTVTITGVSVGETVLKASTPDDQSISVKIVVEESTVTTSTITESTTPITTTTINKIMDTQKIYDILAAYIEENNVNASFADESKYPEFEGAVVIEFFDNSDKLNQLRDFAYLESNLSANYLQIIPVVNGVAITTRPTDPIEMTTTTNTTTTASPTEETTATTTEYDANAFFADIEFYHTGNGPKIPDSFDVKLVRRKVTYSANGEKTYLDEDEVLETWDNSEIHPHRTKTYTSDADYEYAVKVDKLPKLITYNYQDNLRVVLPKADRFYSIYLQKWETEIPKLPISKEVETSLIIYDYSVGLNVPRDGLDVTVYILNEDMSRKKEAGHFITGTDDAKFVVPCYFEDIDDSVPLEIVINNMPDGYIYSSSAFEDRNVAYLSCENLLDAIGTDDLNTFSIKGAIFNTEDTVTTSTVLTGTRTTYTTTTIVTTTTETESVNGDANCDGELSMADAVIIMQSLANPDKYGENGTAETHITNQGKINGDIAGNNDGITNADALAIQKKLLKLE